MELPITSPSGSNPASLTSRNSFTERSLVKRRLERISARRSRAWVGRLLTGVFVLFEGRLFGLLCGALDRVRVVLVGAEHRVAAAVEAHHRQDEGRDLQRRALAFSDAVNAGAEPADVDV